MLVAEDGHRQFFFVVQLDKSLFPEEHVVDGFHILLHIGYCGKRSKLNKIHLFNSEHAVPAGGVEFGNLLIFHLLIIGQVAEEEPFPFHGQFHNY